MSQGSPSPIDSSNSPSSDEAKQARVLKRLGRKTAKMLCNRELYGNVITSVKGRYNFREEYTKRQVSEPTVWAYSWTKGDGSCALEQLIIDSETDLVISGDRAGGALRFGLVVKDTKEDHYGYRCRPDCTCAPDSGEMKRSPPGELWPLNRISFDGISSISCMKKFGNPGLHKILTAAGSSGQLGGCACILDIKSEFILSRFPMFDLDMVNMYEIASFEDIVWTADCNFDGSQAIIGTSKGAALVDVETGKQSWVCRCKSDIFSVQLDPTDKIALCGLSNGAIVTIDVRQRPDRLPRQQLLLHSGKSGKLSSRSSTHTTKHCFELEGSLYYPDTITMPSSISCLASLKLYDQYFLASSVDGSMKLYDHRMVQRGAVQSYKGNVYPSSRIQFGVDPSEKYVMSGGVDGKLRLWSIKSGELLFENLVWFYMPTAVCWHDKGANLACADAWVGTEDGELLCVRWP